MLLSCLPSPSRPAWSVLLQFGVDELLIYNAQHESLTKEWIDAFTKETGIKVTYRQGGDTELGNQLVAEGNASPADVPSPRTPRRWPLSRRPGCSPTSSSRPSIRSRPSSGRRRASGPAWRRARPSSSTSKAKLPADQLPHSIMDLQQPQWKGRWGAPPAKADFQAIVAAILELKGEPATARMAGRFEDQCRCAPRQYRDDAARRTTMAQVDGGIIYHYYWFRDQSKTKEISGNTALHYFKNQDPGAFVSLSGGGVLKSSKKQDQAQQFLRFVTGKAGQEVLQKGTSFEYPVASGVAANPVLPPLDTLQAPEVNPSNLDAAKVTDLMTKSGLL